jgi:ubiquinone biosynthesis protein COQ9
LQPAFINPRSEREKEKEKVEIKAAKFLNFSPQHVPQKGFTSRCLTLS